MSALPPAGNGTTSLIVLVVCDCASWLPKGIVSEIAVRAAAPAARRKKGRWGHLMASNPRIRAIELPDAVALAAPNFGLRLGFANGIDAGFELIEIGHVLPAPPTEGCISIMDATSDPASCARYV